MSHKPTTTEQFVDIADIQGTLVLMKDGSLRSLIQVNSVNFDLKSQDEQMGIIRGFQDFLNALDFPLQVIINSRKLDISKYLNFLTELEQKTTIELLKVQVTEYAKFIKGLTDLANIMKKRFYVVIPYYALEVAPKSNAGMLDKVKELFSSSANAPTLTPENVAKYEEQINQRISVVMAGLTPLGMEAKVLAEKDLMDLYYEYYNPGQELH